MYSIARIADIASAIEDSAIGSFTFQAISMFIAYTWAGRINHTILEAMLNCWWLTDALVSANTILAYCAFWAR